jgi:hypothetical protein
MAGEACQPLDCKLSVMPLFFLRRRVLHVMILRTGPAPIDDCPWRQQSTGSYVEMRNNFITGYTGCRPHYVLLVDQASGAKQLVDIMLT